jgi:YidC/Oxa1 family membrane protein insertase
MDRQAWIAVIACVIGLVAWQFYMAQHAVPPTTAPQPTGTPVPLMGEAPRGDATPAEPGETPAAPAPATAAAAEPVEAITFEERFESLQNNDVELRLTNRGGGIAEARLLHHATDDRRGVIVLNSPDRMPIGSIVENPEAPQLPEFQMARQPDGSVLFERTTPQGVVIRKRYSFLPQQAERDNYLAALDLEFRNDGQQPYSTRGFFVTLGSTMPIHHTDFPSYTRLVWYTDGKSRSVDVNWFPAQFYPLIGVQKREARDYYRETVAPGDWAAMSNQFFTTLVTPLTAKASEVWGRRFEVERAGESPLLAMEGAMGMPGFDLQPGQSTSQRFQIYAGPKIYNRLARLEHGEAEIMNFGFWRLISEGLLNFMNFLHGFVNDYGFAIILLTACVKGVLWPLQNKANRSMRKMALLAPKMQALREKYKDDPTKMNQEVMGLYKRHGVNPVGGCLPMLIQIPVFFGLFTMLGQAAELRHASFLWVSDLSQPDVVARIPGLGFPINLLPLLMAATSFWLIKMTPNTGDPMQRRIIMFMPVIFLIFCYNFAAALALYYTTQNIFTILQLWVNQRQPMPTLDEEPAAPAIASKRAKKRR